MDKPRFSTLVSQAEKQISFLKSNLAAQFFASGMKYRLYDNHIDFIYTDQKNAEIIKGYLRSQQANNEMLKAIDNDTHFATLLFLEGYKYEDNLLSQSSQPVGPSWDADQWRNEFNNTYPPHANRVKVWKSTLDIVQKGYYILPDGKRVDLPLNPNILQESKIYQNELPRILTDETYTTHIFVKNEDCLACARELRNRIADDNICVLNLASYSNPGGGVIGGAGAQEEYLFRCSDYFRSLFQYAHSFDSQSLYGIPRANVTYPLDKNYGGCYSHGVTIFRDTEAKGYALLEHPWHVNFVAVAVPRLEYDPNRTTIPNNILPIVENTIRTIFRIAHSNGQRHLVLGALGCGAFHHPPLHMAQIFNQIINEQEFSNKFETIIFSIIDDHNAANNRQSNYDAFMRVFND